MRDMQGLKEQLNSGYVRKEEFEPIKRLVYGMVGLILTGVLGTLLALALKKI